MNIDRSTLVVVGNFGLFQALWFAAVLGAALGHQWLAPVALMLLPGWTKVMGGNLVADLRLVWFGLATGIVFESLLLASGLIRYELQWWPAVPPLWILCLWAGFAQTFLHSLAWLHSRLWLASVLGGLGSMVSLYAGLRFGAAIPLQGMLPLLLVYGVGWALLVPWLAWLAAESSEHSAEAPAV